MKNLFKVGLALLLGGAFLYAKGAKVDIKTAVVIEIKKGYSKEYIKKVEANAKGRKGVVFVANPNFNCTDAGFNKRDLFSSGTMYGTLRKDGALNISGVGDFKAYSYKNYIKGERRCKEVNYTKKYNGNKFGKYSYALVVQDFFY
jgi:hypothetical protein